MNLELILTLAIAFGVPTGALIFFGVKRRKAEHHADKVLRGL